MNSLRIAIALVGVTGMCLATPPRPKTKAPAARNWLEFGGDVTGSGALHGPSGISAENIGQLQKRQVQLDGTVDAAAIYIHAARIKGAAHDAFFVTTTYGKTIAVDANDGAILWEFTPPGFSSWQGTRQITNSTPVADPDREYIYATDPGGKVTKLAVSDGHQLWSTAITLLPHREKMDSPLRVFDGHVIAVTAGYIGDAPPYQGHVAILDAASGKLLHVWNSLCSNRTGLIEPSSCDASDSAIWGRTGAVIDPATGNIFVATGNAPWNGTTNWGDAVVELNPDATRMLGNWTPANTDQLNDTDLDIGSTSPVLLGGGYVAQGGKDGLIRVLELSKIAGTAPHKFDAPSVETPRGEGRRAQMLFSSPAVWRGNGQEWMFVTDSSGTEAFTFANGKLTPQWKNGNGGTTPVVADGLVYVYGGTDGGLKVYEATSGKQVANLDCGAGHWNSPIVVDGRIALPEGNANRR
ncbi:MAG: PQQ-binding-like beta-propeller repeat protein, partial [Terriglobales bacterium]